MKYLVLIIASLLTLSTAVAQTKKSKPIKKKAAVVKVVSPPSKVDAAFDARFASLGEVTDKKWNKNLLGNYIVSYKNPEALKQTVEYKEDGSFVKSAINFELTNIPEVVKSTIELKFNGAEIKEVKKMEVGELNPYFNVKINAEGKKKQLLIAEEGTLTE